MLNLMVFCQDSENRLVKITTLKKIKKEIDKCDLLKISYDEKTKSFNHLLSLNKNTLMQLSQEEKKSREYQLKINKINKELSKKKSKKLHWFIGGVVGGIIISSLIL